MATIKIRRTTDFINTMRKYSLFIDGKKVGTIGAGQIKEFEIPSGQHSVIAKIDWCSSPEFSFEINDNDSKTFLVGGLKNGRWILPLTSMMIALYFFLPHTLHTYFNLFIVLPIFIFLLYYLTFRRKNYLTLRENTSFQLDNN